MCSHVTVDETLTQRIYTVLVNIFKRPQILGILHLHCKDYLISHYYNVGFKENLYLIVYIPHTLHTYQPTYVDNVRHPIMSN